MTNSVKGSAWGFAFIDPGLLLKKILGSKPRPAFQYSASADLHRKLTSSCSCTPQHPTASEDCSRRGTVQACLEPVVGIWERKPGVLSSKLVPKKAPQSLRLGLAAQC